MENLQNLTKLILESAGEGIFGLDKEGKVTFINPAASRMLGLDQSEAVGEHIHDMIHHTQADGSPRTKKQSLINKTFVDGQSCVEEDDVFWCKDGTSFSVEYNSTPIKDKDEIEGAVVTFRDITERKKAEEELRRHRDNLKEMVNEKTSNLMSVLEEVKITAEEARQADDAKSEFLANISHELRTPMHAILAFSDLGISRMETCEKQKLLEYFDAIKKNGNHLLELINDLLDLSKLESGQIKYNIGKGDLRDVANEAVDQLWALTKQKNLTIDIIDSPDVSTIVYFDNEKIRQVIWNLISNATKFSSEGQTITIAFEDTTLTEFEGGRLVEGVPAIAVVVTDQGIGIPEDEMDIIFDKFIQSSKTRSGAGGTGLGLAICKKIIDVHRGKIFAESSYGDGAEFTFIIPR